jgi:hypothetical protein
LGDNSCLEENVHRLFAKTHRGRLEAIANFALRCYKLPPFVGLAQNAIVSDRRDAEDLEGDGLV